MSKQEDIEQLRVLGPARLPVAEQVRHVWAVMVPIGTKMQDVMRPGYWTHHSARLKPWDRLEVMTEDGTWFMELLVLATDRSWTRVHKLLGMHLTSPDVALTQASSDLIDSLKDTMEVMHRGPKKWSVVRKNDRAVLIEGKAQRRDAEIALEELAKAEAASAAAIAAEEG